MSKWTTGSIIALLVASVMLPRVADGQCMTDWAALYSEDIQDFGLDGNGKRTWVGQQFQTDCAGQFLTVSFYLYLTSVPYNGVPSLKAGDTVTCAILDADNQVIASRDLVLDSSYGFFWILFDFSDQELGLASGTLTAIIETAEDAFGYVATGHNTTPGQLIIGYEGSIIPRDRLETAFRVHWDPYADVVPTESRAWSVVKALYR